MSKNKKNNVFLKKGLLLNNKYKISRKVAKGGFGVVYLAKRYDGQLVALKEFLPSMIDCRNKDSYPHIRFKNAQAAKKFKKGLSAFFNESDKLAKIYDKRIISIWDVFKENGTAYFVMPYEKGGTLQRFITHSRYKNYSINELFLISIFIDICGAIQKMHDNGLLHLDIKPGNIWLRPDNSVVVLDLGASKWNDDEIKHSHMAKTPGFAAPEQHDFFKLHKKVSTQTDVYGICASLLSCIIKHPPITSQQRENILKKRKTKFFSSQFLYDGIYNNLLPLYGDTSPLLINIITKGMSLNINQRYKTVKELGLDLRKVYCILQKGKKINDDKKSFIFNSLEYKKFLSSSPI